MRLLLLTLMLLSVSAPPGAQDRPLAGEARKAFIEKIRKSMAKVRVVVAAFEQEKNYSMFDGVVKHYGFILYQQPDKLRWEIEKPFRSILIVSGTDVAKFEFRKGKRRKLELGRAKDVLLIVMDQIRGWFRGDFAKSEKDYTVEFHAKAPARIVMRPRSKALRKTVESFELRLANDLASVTQVTIREKGGDTTVMRFRRSRPKTKLTARHFDVKAPQGFAFEKAKPPKKAGKRDVPHKADVKK
jgi:outer membrane lipoprotein-sorting protein